MCIRDSRGSSLPTGWSTFTGEPGSDAGAQWASSHVVVGGGVLELNASQDPTFNDEWVTGGLCQCGVSHTYGAYFVRSRLTGAGPTQVELLWPVGHSWPPEIDFDETYGGMNGSMATLHLSLIHISRVSSSVTSSLPPTFGSSEPLTRLTVRR